MSLLVTHPQSMSSHLWVLSCLVVFCHIRFHLLLHHHLVVPPCHLISLSVFLSYLWCHVRDFFDCLFNHSHSCIVFIILFHVLHSCSFHSCHFYIVGFLFHFIFIHLWFFILCWRIQFLCTFACNYSTCVVFITSAAMGDTLKLLHMIVCPNNHK